MTLDIDFVSKQLNFDDKIRSINYNFAKAIIFLFKSSLLRKQKS